MDGRTLQERDRQALSALQKLRFFPLSVTAGAGCMLVEEGGRQLLDLSAAWGAASLGYAHPALNLAVAEAMASQAGASILSSTNAPAVELAEKLLDLVPGSDDRRVWLGHSGSDANEMVARAVPEATRRPRIMAFSGAYHGGTLGSMSISGHFAQEGVEKHRGLILVPYPDPYRPFGDDPGGGALLAHIEHLLQAEGTGEEVGCFFMEPIQSDGGMIVPPPGFLSRLSDLCRRYGILTVCDEVKVGLGRPGRLNCFEHEDFTPDILVLGKGLGGGLPISAVAGPSRIMDHARAYSMQTLHGNPICASAALAVLSTIEADGLAGNADTVGRVLIEEIMRATSSTECVGDVRGRGLAIGVELVKDGTSEPNPDLARKTVFRAWQLGAVLYSVGMHSNVLELTPPLILTESQAKFAAETIAQAIKDAHMGLVGDDDISDFTGW
ncbi:aspartate aminotransferase family protein [Mesorhizobium waimense]|uniref:alanine--glyoxylate transaminase n=1 Tax=Mesorhizobium waimense TaxID=1300307 RepID=A0A3A5JVY6_9HYPH|nr:aspartate aminotransferase family protein [Mesorhizobium waimense]RJT26007.1 aspartate aminotransferase family protein [Mesorhizobium waimense]